MTAHLRDTFALQCKHALTKTDLLEQLKKEKFDVVMAENFDYCGFGRWSNTWITPPSIVTLSYKI